MYISSNQTKQTTIKFDRLEKTEEKFEQFDQILMVNFSSVKSSYFNQFVCLLCI